MAKSAPAAEQFPVRFCPLCRTADTAPRHTIYGVDPDLAPHMDCCRDAGCPDGLCDAILTVAGDARNDDLRTVIQTRQDEIQPLVDARDEATRTFTLADVDPSAQPVVLNLVNPDTVGDPS